MEIFKLSFLVFNDLILGKENISEIKNKINNVFVATYNDRESAIKEYIQKDNDCTWLKSFAEIYGDVEVKDCRSAKYIALENPEEYLNYTGLILYYYKDKIVIY